MYENELELTILTPDGYQRPKSSTNSTAQTKADSSADSLGKKRRFGYTLNVPTIPEERSSAASTTSGDRLGERSVRSSSPSESTSSPSSSKRTQSTDSRMESGAPFPRLAAGIYHRKPQPILFGDTEETLESSTRGASPKSGVNSPMRKPPPTWLPPQPPTNQQDLLSREEETYEDPETIHDMKAHSSRDKLMLPGHGNSYEVSASQMRRSQVHEAPPLEDWSPAECILHKNSEGAYYIPTNSVCAPSPAATTNVSTLPPHRRYDKGCTSSRHSCIEPQVNTALLKRQSTSNSKKMKSLKEDSSRRATPLVFCLLLALLAALLVIIVLLLRAPRYVYSSSYAGKVSMSADRLSELRPLPDTIQLGQRIFADLIPQSIAYTEIYIPRPTRVVLNVTVGTGAQLVLLGRHSVAPSLSLHDLFHPIRAELIATHGPSHSIEESSRKRREAIEIVTPRIASVEHFILEGRWHLAVLNERNRVEPIELIVEALPSALQEHLTNGSSEKKKNIFRCASDCSGRGECVNGVCKCAAGYTGSACEEVLCPLVCSGNGILSLGRCVCFEGYKGRECDVRQHWCEVADCNGRGRCTPRGVCDCVTGWTGDSCEIRSCPHPSCSGRGKCLDGVCYCEDGWTGSECSRNVRHLVHSKPNFITDQMHENGKSHEETHVIVEASPLSPATSSGHSSHPHRTKAHEKPPISTPSQPSQHPNSLKAVIESRETERTEPREQVPENRCNGHGRVDSHNQCICALGFTGINCELESCSPECVQGVCHRGICICKNGWKGIDCSQKECALGCEQHGRCEKNGTCLCDRGWNGENCYLEGCPRDCSGHGQCGLGVEGWRCECDTARRGADCSLPIEHSCDDGVDNDHNGLVDCEDPECCANQACRLEPSCMMAPSPSDVLLKLPTPQNAPFYQRVMFLIKNDSVQSYADYSQFNESIASVVRGRVVWNGGASGTVADLPLPGVRVSDANHPLYGFTLSRLDGGGAFDLLVNGGRTIQLQFLRSPFQRKKLSVYVPPNQIVYVGDVVLFKEKKTEDDLATRVRQECSIAKRTSETIEIRHDWKVWGAPRVNGSAKVLADVGAVIDSIRIPGTQVYLVYDSRRSDGSSSRLEMRLTGSKPDFKLRLVHLQIDVAGRRFTKKLAARADLSYTFSWDKQNVYKQMESGLVNVIVRIGYEYEHCSRESEIFWVTKKTFLAGRARKTSFGGWTPHIHHHYDVVNNVLEKGDGSRLFLSAENPVVDLLIGSDSKRELDCQSCHQAKAESPLLRPVTIASGVDGSILIGDQNLVRRLTPDGRLVTILILSTADTTYQYSLAVSPLDGSIYISIPLQKQIWRIKEAEPKKPEENYEVVAGDGTACASATSSCGDGGLATDAQLLFPKGLAVDNHNQLFVVDGRRVRVVELETNTIRSLTSSQFQDNTPLIACANDPRQFSPISEIQMEWPTAVSIDPSTQTLYVLDTNVIHEFKLDLEIGRVLLGSPSACISNETSLALNNARDIAAGVNGYLYILESDGKKLNQIRGYSQNGGGLVKVAGRASPCSCHGSSPNTQCACDNEAKRVDAQDALFNGPLAIAVDSHRRILIADTENAKVKCVHFPAATFDSNTAQYSIQWPFSDEVYFFNRNGLHLSTRSLVTDRPLYTFNYNVDTHLGRLSQIVSPGGLLLRALWPPSDENSVSIESPSGLRSQLSFSPFDGYLESLSLPTKEVLKFHYGTGGLLLSRSGNEAMISLGYDSFGRANFIFTKNHIYTIDPPRFEEDFLVVLVKKDEQEYLEIKSRSGEAYLGGQAQQKLLTLDEDSFEWTDENGGKILFESEVRPIWGGRAVSRARRSWPSVDEPSRRSLVWRFDWRPFSSLTSSSTLSSSSKSRRVAEVNGLNVFSIAFDRAQNLDVIRGKGEEVMLTIGYTESGEWKEVTPGKDVSLAPMNISYDNLGRRSEITWGSIKRRFSYDRQNRLIERNFGAGEQVFKYTYTKEAPIPVQVDLPNSHKYTMKLDNFGRVQQATSPSGEVHQFSVTAVPQGSLVKRRMPQCKSPSMSVVDGEGRLIEWLSPDEMHHVHIQRDLRNRPIKMIINEKFVTTFEYKNNELATVRAEHFSQTIHRQAELPIQMDEARSHPDCWKNSNFSLSYDDLGRIETLRGNIEGQMLPTVQWKYNKRSGLVESVSGFTILYQGNSQVISNNKMSIQSKYDSHGQLIKREAKFGDVECSAQINRDAHGRQISVEWKRPSGTSTQEIGFEQSGRVAEFVANNENRWSYKYDKDGRIWSINGEQVEWSVGGVARNISNTIYVNDPNGWTTKRGNFTFKMDSLGRLVELGETGKRRVIVLRYDHLNRVISIQNQQKAEYTLFYAIPHQPHRISHFIDSASALVTTLLYTEDGDLFAMTIGNEKYLILSDANRTPRCVLGEDRIVKEIDRSLHGTIVSDTNKTFWIPVGHLGGIDLEEVGVVILNGRPLDTMTGRWMSFGPHQMGLPKTFLDPRQALDPFALSEDEEMVSPPKIPLDMSSWLALSRISITSLAPSTSLLPTDAIAGDSVVSAVQSGFNQRLRYFSRLDSVSQSALGEALPKDSTPTVTPITRDDPGFAELLFIIPRNDKIDVKFSPKLTAEEQKLITDLLESANEVKWPLTSGGWSRHFARGDPIGSRFSSASHPHFTAVVGSDSVELRSAKTRIIVHFETNQDAVRSKLSDDLRRKEAHAVWKMERKLVEKDLATRHEWTMEERRELLGRGSVSGFSVEPLPSSALLSAHHWTFLKQNSK